MALKYRNTHTHQVIYEYIDRVLERRVSTSKGRMENQIKFPSRRHSPLPHLAIGKRRAVTTTAGSIIEHWVQEGAQALFAEGSDRIEWLLIANNECYRWGIWWTIKGRDMVWTGMRGLACSHQLPESKGGGSAGRQNLCVLDKFVRSSAVFITPATHWKRDERRILRRHHRYSWRTHIIYIYIYIAKGDRFFDWKLGCAICQAYRSAQI